MSLLEILESLEGGELWKWGVMGMGWDFRILVWRV